MRITIVVLGLFFSTLFHTQVVGQQLSEKLTKEIEENLDQAKDFEAANDFNQAAFFYSRAATIYWVNGFPMKAIEYFEKTVELNKKIGNLNAIRTIYNNIGMIYTDEEDYPKALQYFNLTLQVSRQMNRKTDITASLLNVANVQSEMGAYTDAAKTLEEANTLAKELNDEKLLRNSYSLLADVYEKLGNSEKSSEYFSLYTAIHRKIQRDEMRQKENEAKKMVDDAKSKVSEIEKAKQETELELLDKQKALKETEENLEAVELITKEQEMQIALLNTEKELKDAIIKNQRMVRNIFIVVIIGVLAFAAMIFYNLKEKKKANTLLSKQNREIAEQKDLIEQANKDLEIAFDKIEKQNRDITSSITYAQRIQQAMLPLEENLKKVIPDSFVLLKPRDIVSGDFYWFTGFASAKIQKEKPRSHFMRLHNVCADESGFLITAVDCTGHGVPGAFMSMIGLNLLENITRNGIVMPNEMLNKLHNSIRYLLKQHNSDNHDGMDMALCHIKDNGRTVLFAGAKNPLIFITNGELTTLKGNSVPIGGMQLEGRREFTQHTLEIEQPTAFYIFSDGYVDQFGGTKGKKFSTPQFKELLLEIHKKPMDEQKIILENRITEWIGNGKQIDDILVIGFRTGTEGIDI
jgi:serine phosphatase RsbU (regulator of sigma subunit)